MTLSAREEQRVEQEWLYAESASLLSSDDPRDTNWQLRATRYFSVLATLLAGRLTPGAKAHVELLDYEEWRDSFAAEIRDRYDALERDAALPDDGAISLRTKARRTRAARESDPSDQFS
jgi:hypothetical protein